MDIFICSAEQQRKGGVTGVGNYWLLGMMVSKEGKIYGKPAG